MSRGENGGEKNAYPFLNALAGISIDPSDLSGKERGVIIHGPHLGALDPQGERRVVTAVTTLPVALEEIDVTDITLDKGASRGNSALLANSLLVVANHKNDRRGNGWLRGMACSQLVAGVKECRLVLYEGGYSATLFPRFVWRGPIIYPGSMQDVLLSVLVKELDEDDFLGEMARGEQVTVNFDETKRRVR